MTYPHLTTSGRQCATYSAAAAMVRVFSRCGIVVPVVTASNHVVTSFFEEDAVVKKFDGNKNPGWTSGMTLPNKNPRKIQS